MSPDDGQANQGGLAPSVRQALDLTRSSSAAQRTIDITTVGARSGRSRRIEIWFHRAYGRWYLSSAPAKRSWYANLLANPRFTVHVKWQVHADLQATGVPVRDPEQRRTVLAYIVDELNQPSNPGAVHQPQHLEDWLAGSPLIEIRFDDIPDRGS